jgi:hypothetical protein
LSIDKPLGKKAYGSIPHLPKSRLGSGDHYISEGQARIATEKLRDKHDYLICEEKLDGTNVAIAKLKDHRVVALGRSGYLAESSPYLQHLLFSDWVYDNYDRFDQLLNPGEWISGEWLALAHGTVYELQHEPFVAFDLWVNNKRVTYSKFRNRIGPYYLIYPRPLFMGGSAFSIEKALTRLEDKSCHGAIDPIEGAVWRVERGDEVEFLCKYVRHDKLDGKYLSDVSGQPPVWNKGLENYLPSKALKKLKETSLDTPRSKDTGILE